jgi:hypothetical protein
MSPNKKDALLKALRREWLTPLEAVERVGIFSLSQRCGEFRRAGMNVLDKWVTTASGSRVKAYRIARG